MHVPYKSSVLVCFNFGVSLTKHSLSTVQLSIDWKIPGAIENILPNVSSNYNSSLSGANIFFDKSGSLVTSGPELSDEGNYKLTHSDISGYFIVELTVIGGWNTSSNLIKSNL